MNCLSVMHFCLFLDRVCAEFFFGKKNWFSEVWIFFRLFTFGWYIIVQVFVLAFMTTYLVTFKENQIDLTSIIKTSGIAPDSKVEVIDYN